MNTLQIHTNLHCQKCVDKVTPLLDQDKNIESWSVSWDNQINQLHLKGKNLSQKHIGQLLSKEGYKIIETKTAKTFTWGNVTNWKKASFNTFNCLIGCSIGDFGMIIFLQAYYPDTPMATQMVLAIIAGLMTSIALETVLLKYKDKFNWSSAFKKAIGMSFLSMLGMEIAMNTTDFIITGGKAAFDSPMYWSALGIALVAGFIFPLPYNYYILEKHNRSCH